MKFKIMNNLRLRIHVQVSELEDELFGEFPIEEEEQCNEFL